MDDITWTNRGGEPSALRLDRQCDRFEAEWRAGRRPDAAVYLVEAAEQDRSRLLRELIALERELRAGSGERPTPAEYRARFPQHTALIDDVFGESTPPTRAGLRVRATRRSRTGRRGRRRPSVRVPGRWRPTPAVSAS